MNGNEVVVPGINDRCTLLENQVKAASHHSSCAYWKWDWQHSWDKTDCTCEPEAQLLISRKLLRDLYDAFYEYADFDQQEKAIAVAGEYLHDKVNSDGQFPDEEVGQVPMSGIGESKMSNDVEINEVQLPPNATLGERFIISEEAILVGGYLVENKLKTKRFHIFKACELEYVGGGGWCRV